MTFLLICQILWPIGQVNKTRLAYYFSDTPVTPLDQIEVFCNIFREVVKQETTQWRNLSSHGLVHHGSVFNYFYNPGDIMDPTDRLVYLFDVTHDVHLNNENIIHCHSVLENFDEEESLQDKTELDSDNVEKISFSFLSGIDSTNYKYQHRNSRTS